MTEEKWIVEPRVAGLAVKNELLCVFYVLDVHKYVNFLGIHF